MAVFFNGRLWETPATMSLVDDSAMYNKNLSVGNVLAIVGRSEGGEPFKALRFGNAGEARAVLRSGEALKAIEKAFDPSAQTFAPAEIVFFRVNNATQSTAVLKDDQGADAINLVSTDFGAYTTGIKYKVESGSVKGKKLTTQFGSAYFSADNVAADLITVVYTGAAASASVTVTGTTVTVNEGGLNVATIDLSQFSTVYALADRISSIAGFNATVLDGNGEKPTLNALDYVSGLSVMTSGTITGNLQACIDWFNSAGEGYVTATRAANAGRAPVNTAYAYLSGGSDGSVSMTEWQKAYEELQKTDVQWVVPISPDPAIHAMNDAHCAYMSNIARMERRGFVGTNVSTSDDNAIAAAKALNSDRTALLHLGFYDYDANGKLKLFPPYILAAQVAGAFSGVNPATPLTNKTLKVRGLERDLRNPTDTDRLIRGGVFCVENTPKGYKVVKSISTWLTNTNYNRVEISTGVGADFTARNVRNAVDDLRGGKASPSLLSEIISRTETTLKELARPEPMGVGVLVGDAASPAYKNITASIDGDVVRLEFQASVAVPANYIPIVIHIVPYSGSASA